MRRDGRITLAVAIECVTTLGPHSNGLDEFGSFVLRLPEFKFRQRLVSCIFLFPGAMIQFLLYICFFIRKCTNNFLPIRIVLVSSPVDPTSFVPSFIVSLNSSFDSCQTYLLANGSFMLS
ncbi:uncharacterized protein [Euphorbia lathyris]|uniref:uncharacterized protein isoform X3 n=1 Tax=Euphorbia lathyris TaxID=212925 RepID=UPI003313ADB9